MGNGETVDEVVIVVMTVEAIMCRSSATSCVTV